MANLPNKLFTFTTLLLLGSAYSCSGGDSSGDSPVESSPTSAPISQPESTLPVAPPTEPLANVAPNVTYTDIDAVITLLNSQPVNIDYAVDDDSDDVTTNLYHSSTSVNCSEANISDWSLAATSTELSATLSWSHTESGIYNLCLVADDGEERHYSIINSDFIVLPGGMELWLKSDTGISESSGSIARWDDQSGKERNFVAESEVNKPLLKTSSLKGKDTVYFDGINDFLTNSDDFNVTSSIVVFKADSARQASNQLAELWGDYVGKVHVSIDPRSPGSFSFDGKSPSSTTAKYYLEGSSFSTHIANGKRQDSWNYDETHFLVSEFNESKNLSNTTIAHLNDSSAVNHWFAGEIAEIMLFDKSLSENERKAVNAYLQQRWNDVVIAKPDAPQNLTSSFIGSDRVVINWDSYARESISFYISYDLSSNSQIQCRDDNFIERESESLSLTGLESEKTYKVVVCAVDKRGFPYQVSEASSLEFTTIAQSNAPLPPNANMSLWLNARGGIVSSSEKVSSWMDAASGISLTQADSSRQPTSSSDSISFDGVDDHIDSNDPLDVKNIFIVFKVDSSRQSTSQLGGVFGNYGEGVHVGIDARSSNLNGYSFDGGSNTTASYSQDLTNYEASAEDSNNQAWAYDTINAAHINYDNIQSISSFGIGTLFNGPSGHLFGGSIYEILIYDADLSPSELTEVKDYLNFFYGLSL